MSFVGVVVVQLGVVVVARAPRTTPDLSLVWAGAGLAHALEAVGMDLEAEMHLG